MSELHESSKLGPRDFVPPLVMRSTHKDLGGDFELRPLRQHHAVSDFKAVITNAAALRHIFAEEDSWPSDNITLEEDKLDLKRHYMEFSQNLSFAYTVLEGHSELDDENRDVIGCVYINPATKSGFAAEVILWTTDERSVASLQEREDALLKTIEDWICSDVWSPVLRGRQVAFPGRKESWAEWDNLPWRDESVPRINESAGSIVLYNAKASGLAK